MPFEPVGGIVVSEDTNDSGRELAHEVMQHFLLPLPEDSIFSDLEKAVREAPHDFAGAAEAFMHNLKGALYGLCPDGTGVGQCA